jgi:hypothetical protein
MQKLNEALRKSRKSKMPSVIILLRADHNYYRYRADIAMELIKNHKAEMVEVLE